MVDARRLFIVLDLELGFVKGPQSVTHFAKAVFRPYSRKQFLTDRSDNLRTAILH